MPLMDQIDKALIRLLAQDGRMSFSDLSETLKVTRPTVRTRTKALIKQGVLRIAGLVDAEEAPDLTVALVAINIESRGELNEQVRKLSDLDEVHWAAVVTGRFDIIAEVVVAGGMKDLHRFTTLEIPRLGRVTHSETFVVMQGRNKWLRLHKGLKNW